MAEMLLINPRKRRAAPKRRTAKRRRNPLVNTVSRAPAKRRVTRRRRNPITLRSASRRTYRRRRNPINLGSAGRGIMGQITNALIGGAGAVGVDVLMGQIAPFLPASLRRVPGRITIGDAVKAGITVAAGELLAKPTRGASRKMAMGALTVQAADMLKSFVPATLTLGEFGYASPAAVAYGSPLIGPNAGSGIDGVDAYVDPTRAGGGTPLLDAYTGPGGSPLLDGINDGAEYSESGQFLG